MRETINQDKKEKLLKRKQEIELLVADGYEFETLDINSVDDEEIAFHKMVSDLIIKLQGMRKAKGLTQTVVAQRMGTKQTAISRFEKYCGVPTLDFIYNYAFAIGVKLGFSTIDSFPYTIQEEKQEQLFEIAKRKGTCLPNLLDSVIDGYIESIFVVNNNSNVISYETEVTKHCKIKFNFDLPFNSQKDAVCH